MRILTEVKNEIKENIYWIEMKWSKSWKWIRTTPTLKSFHQIYKKNNGFKSKFSFRSIMVSVLKYKEFFRNRKNW